MRELVLTAPQNRTDAGRALEANESSMRREFEGQLPESVRLAFRVARAVLRNDADAEDVAQETLLRAFRRFDRLRDRTRFRSWLVRIAYRLALDRLRTRKRIEQRDAAWLREAKSLASSRPSVVGSDFSEQLERAVADLPEKLRIVLLLSAMEGHTMEEVAELLAIPIGTVKSRLFLARKNVAEKLQCFVNPIDRH